MPTVWIPSPCRDLSRGAESVCVSGATVRELIDALDRLFPGLRPRLCAGDGIRPGTQIVVDGQVARLGLRQPVSASSEVHFVPAIGGG